MLLDNGPDALQVDSQVRVNDDIAKSTDLFPRNLRMCFPMSRINAG